MSRNNERHEGFGAQKRNAAGSVGSSAYTKSAVAKALKMSTRAIGASDLSKQERRLASSALRVSNYGGSIADLLG